MKTLHAKIILSTFLITSITSLIFMFYVYQSEKDIYKREVDAKLTVIDSTHATLEITEGRYHQVRRMFAAVGNHVVALHRSSFGNLTLVDLEVGEYYLIGTQSLTK